MSSEELTEVFVHTVAVHTYLGTTGAGAKRYSPALTDPGTSVPCFLERKQRFIRGADGDQVVSSATVYADIAHTDVLLPQSLLSISGQRDTVVLQRDVHDGGTFVQGIDHVEAYLQ